MCFLLTRSYNIYVDELRSNKEVSSSPFRVASGTINYHPRLNLYKYKENN